LKDGSRKVEGWFREQLKMVDGWFNNGLEIVQGRFGDKRWFTIIRDSFTAKHSRVHHFSIFST